MYIPPAFWEERIEALHDLMRRHSFATLVSVLGGELFSTHLPLLLDPARGEYGTLVGHLARANPHWRAFDSAGTTDQSGPETLAIFSGPHAYVSPSWYETEMAVPTWNYVAVHAYGRPRVIEDAERLKRVLADLVGTYESGFERPWQMDRLPDDYVNKMAANVVGFEIEITRLEGKRKLSQNRPQADRAGAIAGLRRHGGPEGKAVAEMMERVP